MEESKRIDSLEISPSPALENTILESSNSDLKGKTNVEGNAGQRVSTQKWPSHDHRSYDSQERGNTWTRKSPDIIMEEAKQVMNSHGNKRGSSKKNEKIHPSVAHTRLPNNAFH